MKNIVLSFGIVVMFSMLVISIATFAQFDNVYRINTDELVGMSAEEMILYIQDKQINTPPIFSYIFPLFAFGGVLVGLIVFYILSSDAETYRRKDKTLHDGLLRYLPQDERLVMQEILRNEGRANQYEITRLPGMNKVKSHRAVEKLVQRGVIKKETLGKINRLVIVEK
jgi:hypothetical protein